MANKILAINELENYKIENTRYRGYEVVTEQEKIYVLIDSDLQCCESFGYMSTNDDITEFIGAELLDVELTDISLNPILIEKNTSDDFTDDFEDIQFVNFITTKNVDKSSSLCNQVDILQLVVYNYHNGYYSHDIKVIRNNYSLFDD
jgi:hypothetical protein